LTLFLLASYNGNTSKGFSVSESKGKYSMDPVTITRIGFLVAALILVWAAFEMSRRLYRRKKIDTRVMNTWVPLHPSSPDTSAPKTESDEQDKHSRSNHHSRAQQNGHHSESKKI
jgi:hypothetical protein